MLGSSLQRLKKRTIPMGFGKQDFFRKVKNPRATKPWRDRGVMVAGRVEVSSNTDVLTPSGEGTVLGRLSTAAPLGMRSPHLPPQASSSSAPMGLLPDHNSDAAGQHALVGASSAPPASVVIPSDLSMVVAPPPLATLPFGKALELQVDHTEKVDGAGVPIHLEQFARKKNGGSRSSILLPRHINDLFHKIMGWSEELVEMDAEKNLSGGEDGKSGDATPKLLRQKMSNLTEKMKYGVLLDAHENDKFALEHKLEVAGNKLERKFLEWEGVHVLDQDASQELPHVHEHKMSVVIDRPSGTHIPVVNQDCCTGCGALLQDKSEDDFGYVRPGEIERFVMEGEAKAVARHEYAARMAELQAHWEKNGRQVGEEWLDFMTQEEFNAFYRDRRAPFVCHRCHALENLGVTGRRKVFSAPDFTEQLRSLKEKRCVVVLVVDITDFPGTMIYDLPGLISMNNDVIIVANKMDCIRTRSFNYAGGNRAVAASLVSERYIRKWVQDIATQFGLPRHQIKDVIPVSAKRGWNVEKLIARIEEVSNLNLRRPTKPLPTYFVGVANVGKSSVINAVAHYLFIPQPPHPQSTKVFYTSVDAKTGKEAVRWRWHTPPHVNQAEMIDIPSRHDKTASKLMTVSSLPGTTVSTNAVRISLTGSSETNTFLYDTPGLLPHWHQQSPLTILQMRRALQRKFRNPQCFVLIPGHSLFLGGLAVVDVVKGPLRGLLFMVYTSHKTRNAIVNTERSSEFWQEQLGKALDPPGSMEQLMVDGTHPSLSEQKTYLFECYGKHRRRPKADVYVCGLGWCSFCVAEPADVVLRVRTLPGVVHGVREPLRYNDLRAFRHWPKLQRRFTSKGVEDREKDVDDDSINTVVRLVAKANTEGVWEPPINDPSSSTAEDGAKLELTPVVKEMHPRHATTSSSPFDELVEELETAGSTLSA